MAGSALCSRLRQYTRLRALALGNAAQCNPLRKRAPRTLAPYTSQSQRTNFNLQPPWLGKLISCQLPSSACGHAQGEETGDMIIYLLPGKS